MFSLSQVPQCRLAAKLFCIFLFAVFAFGMVYFALSQTPTHGIRPSHGDPSILDCIYFSVVTVSTLGYGDISPVGLSRLVACLEAVFGLAFVGYAISQIVSLKQESLIEYLANDRIIQTYSDCLETIKDAKEIIADKRRLIQTKAAVDAIDYIYNRSNPFYPALRAVEVLNGYTEHIKMIGKAPTMSDKIDRAAHHVEELAGFTRKLINLLISNDADWRTPRTILILTTLCNGIDAFIENFTPYTRYSSQPYKGSSHYGEVVRSHTAYIRKQLETPKQPLSP